MLDAPKSWILLLLALSFEYLYAVFGNEVDGVDQKVINASDYIIEIPQFGTKHSLNVSVCAGAVLWEFAKRCLLNISMRWSCRNTAQINFLHIESIRSPKE